MDKPERVARRRGGFTLVEIMIATLIFSMVAAGLAAIYSTAFKQSARTLHDQRLRSRAALSGKVFARVVSGATRLEVSPGGDVLRACHKVPPPSAPAADLASPPGPGIVRAYALCVQPNPVNGCPTANPPPPAPPSRGPGCLYYYEWSGGAGVCTGMPAIGSANCGVTIAGAGAEFLADQVRPLGGYFTRAANTVRARFTFGRAATAGSVRQEHAIDVTASAQMDGRLP